MNFTQRIIITILICCRIPVFGQQIDITPLFNSSAYMPYYTLWDIDVETESTASQYYFIQMELFDNSNQLLISRTKSFRISTGLTPFNILMHNTQTGNFEYEWKNSGFYKSTQQTGGFIPPGDYYIKYTLFSTTKGCNWAGVILFTKTIPLSIGGYNLLDLVSPLDGDTLMNIYPNLIWLPVSPQVNNNVTYQLTIVRVMEGQTPEESINNNLPYFEQRNIHTTTLLYPLSARLLEHGHHYAWKVTAFLGQTVLAYSPVYNFYIPPNNKPVTKKDVNPFFIELYPQAPPQKIILSDNTLYLSYIIKENIETPLQYRIINLETGKAFITAETEPLIAGSGKNLYTIDISRLPTEKEYKLEIQGLEKSDIRSLFFYLKKD